jgi:alpha-acetolactate decarboxylase
MLGYLRMNVGQATEALVSVGSAVFTNDTEGKSDPETNMKNLKKSIEKMLQANNLPLDIKMDDKRRPSAACKVYVLRRGTPACLIRL